MPPNSWPWSSYWSSSKMMMIVYWYLFSNHYTRECIHTCERERTCGSSQSSPGFVLAPSSWCRHASHAHHPPSPPCLVSSQAGFGMQCYSLLHARWPQCVYRGQVQADPVYLWSSLHAPPRLRRQLIYTYANYLPLPPLAAISSCSSS